MLGLFPDIGTTCKWDVLPNKHAASIFRAEMCEGNGRIIQAGGKEPFWRLRPSPIPFRPPPIVVFRDHKILPCHHLISSGLKLEAVCSSKGSANRANFNKVPVPKKRLKMPLISNKRKRFGETKRIFNNIHASSEKSPSQQIYFYCMGLEFVAIIGQWLQVIKITRPGLQCYKSQQQTFRLIHILKYFSVVLTLLCVQCYTTFSSYEN
jgi:hypothetical protein